MNNLIKTLAIASVVALGTTSALAAEQHQANKGGEKGMTSHTNKGNAMRHNVSHRGMERHHNRGYHHGRYHRGGEYYGGYRHGRHVGYYGYDGYRGYRRSGCGCGGNYYRTGYYGPSYYRHGYSHHGYDGYRGVRHEGRNYR